MIDGFAAQVSIGLPANLVAGADSYAWKSKIRIYPYHRQLICESITRVSGKLSLDLNMEYYVRVPMKMVTKVGLSSLFNEKHEEVDLAQVDAIEYMDKNKKIALMNLKVMGKPEDFKVALGKYKNKKL
jgi:hypothetical protein